MKKFFKRKKGFSIVEVVIAMAVITIVSFTGVSVLSSATGHVNNARLQTFAVNDIASMWECFVVSETQTEFESALAFGGLDFSQDEDSLQYRVESSNGYIYYVDLNARFEENGGRYFHARAINKETGKLLYEYKGV